MPVRADNGDFVDQISAVKAWAQAAHEILVEVAARPRGAIEPGTLAREVQKRTGIQANQPASKWVAPLLGMIARNCDKHAIPLLPSLVVRRDGTVGPLWDEVLRYAQIVLPTGLDREAHAERERSACQARWAGHVPAAGATARPSAAAGVQASAAAARPVTAKAATGRRSAKPEPLHGNACPRCFMQMSLTGVCDNCD